jgi:hypothetical protein
MMYVYENWNFFLGTLFVTDSDMTVAAIENKNAWRVTWLPTSLGVVIFCTLHMFCAYSFAQETLLISADERKRLLEGCFSCTVLY